MAATVMLVTGPNVLIQNQVYVMPGKSKFVLADNVLATAVTSGGTFTAVASSTTTGVIIPGSSFVKATVTTTNCVLSNQ